MTDGARNVDGASTTDGASFDGGLPGTVIFAQPTLVGVVLPPSTNANVIDIANPAPDQFTMIGWQANPNTASGNFVPVSWDAGTVTGLTVSSPATSYQAGFADVANTTTAQIEGDAVGAFLNSAELSSSTDDKIMITPEVIPSHPVTVFPTATATLYGSLELEIPIADVTKPALNGKPSDAYVNLGLLLATSDPNAPQITLNANLFAQDQMNPADRVGQDDITQHVELQSPIGFSSYITRLAGSEVHQYNAWPGQGYKTFAFSMTNSQFQAALTAIASSQYGAGVSTTPGDYQLVRIHLNAEGHFGGGPIKLGWSMKDLLLTRTN